MVQIHLYANNIAHVLVQEKEKKKLNVYSTASHINISTSILISPE